MTSPLGVAVGCRLFLAVTLVSMFIVGQTFNKYQL